MAGLRRYRPRPRCGWRLDAQLFLKMPEPNITVRRASASDLDLLVPLFDQYRHFYRQPGDVALARRFLSERLQHQESIVFLAMRADGTAMGFTQLFPSFSSASAARIFILNDLFVAPEARRTGVGSMLLAAAVEYGRAAGAVRLTLSTAHALYESAGWTRQTDFYVYNLHL
jgi:GNAT superfamily N-acetyltransferase